MLGLLTNNSPDLCVLTLCIEIRQNNVHLASLARTSANLNENYRRYNFHALANITENFRKIYNPNDYTVQRSTTALPRQHSLANKIYTIMNVQQLSSTSAIPKTIIYMPPGATE